MSDPNESLRRISIFADIPDSEIVQIEAKCAWQSYPPGVNIIDRMSTSRNVYFITKGMVRVMVFSENGREISLDDVEAGMFFGELSAIDGAPRSANVVTVYSTTAAVISRESFLEILADHPAVAMGLMQRMTEIIRASTNRIMDLSTLSAHGRIYGELKRLAEKRVQKDGSGRISPIPVHSELASRVSTTRETVARVLSDLNKKRIVVKERNVLVVQDIRALDALMKIN